MTLVRLASTPEALIASLRAIPVFTELQLAGMTLFARSVLPWLAPKEQRHFPPLCSGRHAGSEVLEDLARHGALLTQVRRK